MISTTHQSRNFFFSLFCLLMFVLFVLPRVVGFQSPVNEEFLNDVLIQRETKNSRVLSLRLQSGFLQE